MAVSYKKTTGLFVGMLLNALRHTNKRVNIEPVSLEEAKVFTDLGKTICEIF